MRAFALFVSMISLLASPALAQKSQSGMYTGFFPARCANDLWCYAYQVENQSTDRVSDTYRNDVPKCVRSNPGNNADEAVMRCMDDKLRERGIKGKSRVLVNDPG